MKLYLTFGSQEKISLPTHYNHIIQAAILNWIEDEAYQKFIHDIGYVYEGRNFKLFTFSKLIGEYTLTANKKEMIFESKVKIVISSSQVKFIECIEKGLRNPSKVWRLGHNEVRIISISKEEEPLVGEEIVVRSLSPIVAYNTVLEEEKKKTKYYGPEDMEFERILRQNLIKKYNSIVEMNPSLKVVEFKEDDFRITVVKPKMLSKAIVYYKGFVIVGFNGKFKLQGHPILLQLALEAGLGGKNAQGFGCMQYIK
ncbi:CRISPR-associated endoribonuclease Cas6 [Cellulosilyticum ruminicola]|uniref:CRISPR-associated endoribonuclease Cas6 n=1 Tax=Cellulosilyticum ruminicola TaxID=425254 RepID=UPI0006D1C729|nr:CRISPR-associated endoribonuclease Cas6 [Cellulosilyticum ruminicola]